MPGVLGVKGRQRKALDANPSLAADNPVASMADVDAVVPPVTSVAGKTGAVLLAKADVGLSNVDNTSDASKPVSTAQAAADNLRLLKSGGTMTGKLITAGGIDTQGQPIEDLSAGWVAVQGNLYVADGGAGSDIYTDGGVFASTEVAADALIGNRLVVPLGFGYVPLSGSKTLLLTTADPGMIVIGQTPATGGIVKLPSLDSGDNYMLNLVNRTSNSFTLSKDGLSNSIVNLAGGIGNITVTPGMWLQLGYYGGALTFYQIGG